ncbi:MAG: hypothetical protein RML72_09195 [Bacteroidia bacterium]|nr:hypothetical protein [Bacteroidia bacterium]
MIVVAVVVLLGYCYSIAQTSAYNAYKEFQVKRSTLRFFVQKKEWKKADSLLKTLENKYGRAPLLEKLQNKYQKQKEERTSILEALAAQYYKQRKVIKAAPLYRELIELAPNNLFFHLRYASCLEAQNQNSLALSIYHKILSQYPDYSDTLMLKYIYLLKKEEKYEEALQIIMAQKKNAIFLLNCTKKF